MNPASVGTAAAGTVVVEGEGDQAISVAVVVGMIVEEGVDRIVEVTVALLVDLVMTKHDYTQSTQVYVIKKFSIQNIFMQ